MCDRAVIRLSLMVRKQPTSRELILSHRFLMSSATCLLVDLWTGLDMSTDQPAVPQIIITVTKKKKVTNLQMYTVILEGILL